MEVAIRPPFIGWPAGPVIALGPPWLRSWKWPDVLMWLFRFIILIANSKSTVTKNWIWEGWNELGPNNDNEHALGDVVSPKTRKKICFCEYEPLEIIKTNVTSYQSSDILRRPQFGPFSLYNLTLLSNATKRENGPNSCGFLRISELYQNLYSFQGFVYSKVARDK